MELKEIKNQLPAEIEGKSLDFFLKEMVLKAGLLYESEGKYGFLFYPFLEYLAALHFARGKDQNAILEFKDKDYWTEIFKLFVNIANIREFFNEIITNLFDYYKGYWLHLPLWNACLEFIVIEEVRQELEMRLENKIHEFMLPEEQVKWNSYAPGQCLKYFAKFDRTQLKKFQFDNPEYIAGELGKGNVRILQEEAISEETLDKVEQIVVFDIHSIEKLLDFEINFENPKENRLLLKAFVILKRANYQKWRELMVEVITAPKNERIYINALYIFKKVN
jgi:hypothetical protein